MKDPVFVDSGNTYERAAIVKWLSKSNKDPLTMEELRVRHNFRCMIISVILVFFNSVNLQSLFVSSIDESRRIGKWCGTCWRRRRRGRRLQPKLPKKPLPKKKLPRRRRGRRQPKLPKKPLSRR